MSKKLVGTIVSDKMNKTRVVEVESLHVHHKYSKLIRRTKRYKAHDPENAHKLGEKVTIEECRPISKDKRFVISDT